jgi:hypothetical protein
MYGKDNGISLNIATSLWVFTSVTMVQAAIKPQPGRNFPDFNSGRTAQKVVEVVVEACEVVVGSWP